jgi:transcriptional regulator with XRE-family HTH domain
MQFHDKLQKLRKEKGLSQESLADMLGVSRQAVSKWESGQAYPETDKLIVLSEFFGVTLDSLLKDGGGEPPLTMAAEAAGRESYWLPQRRVYEYKSKETLYGLPVVHINIGFGNRRAKGIVAIGNVAQGFVSIGLVSAGLVSIGLLSLGLIGFGVLALGLLLAIGTVSIGIFSIGAIAVGIFTLGAVSIGVYSIGALAVASRVAVGDYAYAPVAAGRTVAKGAHEIVSATREYSAISTGEVRRAILSEFPNTRDWIINWLTWFLGR